ncbi:hypothetical protein ACFOWE_14625 [Planomonospora corallina]|uniref:Uncharacterized protein n=1 Tax=Planomonospora corallina TaxID=1806052 RepID=A0ABV8I863_9ACTN
MSPENATNHRFPYPDEKTGRRVSPLILVLSILWALIPAFSFGLLTFAVIGSAAIRLKSRAHGIAAGIYGVTLVAFVSTAGIHDFPAGAWRNELALWIWIAGLWGGGAVHALVLRGEVFRPRPAEPQPPSPPAFPRTSSSTSVSGPFQAPMPFPTAGAPFS